MSKFYGVDPIDFSGISTISLQERGGKVTTASFAKAFEPGSGIAGFLAGIPDILAGQSLRSVVNSIVKARDRRRSIIWGIGGHVIKCGLAPVLIDLMRRGFATAFAMNGSASIHDLEICLAGQTSEDVEAVLPGGRFGVAEETGREWNNALRSDRGAGECLGEALDRLAHPDYAAVSILLQAWRSRVPVTVHVAIGTDTPHIHPAVDPLALGGAVFEDFRLFCGLLRGLNDGGVYINAGSAVVLPEVFLKAVSAVRNLGYPLQEFTTVNMDFVQHYRPRVNVVERPHAQAGGQGYSLTGHHELMIPLLAACLIDS